MSNLYPVEYAESSEQPPVLKTGELTDNGDGTWSVSPSGPVTGFLRPPPGDSIDAPLILDATGTLVSVPDPGSVEFAGTTFYMTTDGARSSVNLCDDVHTSDDVLENTTVETTLHTFNAAADFLTAGKLVSFKCLGHYSTRNASDTLTVRLKHNGITLATLVTPGKNVTNTGFKVEAHLTQQTVGVAGVTRGWMQFQGSGAPLISIATSTGTLDTTAPATLSLTYQWSFADAANTLTEQQGWIDVRG